MLIWCVTDPKRIRERKKRAIPKPNLKYTCYKSIETHIHSWCLGPQKNLRNLRNLWITSLLSLLYGRFTPSNLLGGSGCPLGSRSPITGCLHLRFFAYTNLVLKSLIARHSCLDESAAFARLAAAQIVSLAGLQSWLRCDGYPGSAWTAPSDSGLARAATFFSRFVATGAPCRFHRRLADQRNRRRNDHHPAGRSSIV
jgi:hypothetical protein